MVGSVTGVGVGELTRTRWTNLLPIVFVMYTIAYFDRANIGLALPYVSKDLGLTPVQGGIVGSVFTWGYFITQVFSGWLTARMGSRAVVGWALWLWGLAAVGSAFVRSYEELLAVRLLLGLFEGPVFAATAALLSEWFAKPERGRAFGFWNLSSPTGAFLAGPISGYLLAHYDWRWMMLVEGLPAWIWAVLWWWRIPASVDAARWLPAGERTALQEQLAAEQATLAAPQAKAAWWSIFSEPSVWLSFLGFTLINQLITGYTLWLPTLLKGLGDMPIQLVGWLSGLPFLAGMFGIFLITWHSDRHGQERRWHAAIPTVITGLVLMAAMALPASAWVGQIALLVAAGFTMKMFLPLIFTRLTETLPRSKAIVAVVFVNTGANLVAGTAGPLLIGYARQQTGGFGLAFTLLGLGGVIGGVLFALVGAGQSRRAAVPAAAGR